MKQGSVDSVGDTALFSSRSISSFNYTLGVSSGDVWIRAVPTAVRYTFRAGDALKDTRNLAALVYPE